MRFDISYISYNICNIYARREKKYTNIRAKERIDFKNFEKNDLSKKIFFILYSINLEILYKLTGDYLYWLPEDTLID